MNALSDKIQKYLENTLLLGAIEKHTDLIDSGKLDSMQILELSIFIEETCDVVLDADDMQVENFCSIDAIVDFICSKKKNSF